MSERWRRRRPGPVVMAGALALFTLQASRAWACSMVAADLYAIPRAGTTGVSTTTSLFVAHYGEPTDLSLLVDGEPVAPVSLIKVGPGAVDSDVGAIPGTFWKLSFGDAAAGGLKANATYVLSWGAKELTRFTTAASSDDTAGTAPELRGLKLWRVRYPRAEGSACIPFMDDGFVTVDYVPATIPQTPPEAVIHTFTLTPRQGGAAQTFLYAGAVPFPGHAPEGRGPSPIPGPWIPDLDPAQEYCLTISATGDGGDARPAITSAPLCAPVTSLITDGVSLRPANGTAPEATTTGGGGCTVAAARPSSLAVLAASLGVLAPWLRRRRATRRPGTTSRRS